MPCAPLSPPDACSGEPSPILLHLRIAYDGTAYRGWQVQPHEPTVQAELAEKLRRLLRDDSLRTEGTSRTDAGVHALDQNVVCEATASFPAQPDMVSRVLNRWLPDDIRIRTIRNAPTGFSARHDARAKAYVYGIHQGVFCSPFESRYLWHFPRELAIRRMQSACKMLLGEHDFASFGVNPKRELDNTVRTLYRFDLTQVGDRLFFCVIGDRFLYKMVRSLVGYVVSVGLDEGWHPADTETVLAACNRGAAADTAPARGLFLARVFFEPDEWLDYTPPLPPYSAL